MAFDRVPIWLENVVARVERVGAVFSGNHWSVQRRPVTGEGRGNERIVIRVGRCPGKGKVCDGGRHSTNDSSLLGKGQDCICIEPTQRSVYNEQKKDAVGHTLRTDCHGMQRSLSLHRM